MKICSSQQEAEVQRGAAPLLHALQQLQQLVGIALPLQQVHIEVGVHAAEGKVRERFEGTV